MTRPSASPEPCSLRLETFSEAALAALSDCQQAFFLRDQGRTPRSTHCVTRTSLWLLCVDERMGEVPVEVQMEE